MGWPRFCSGTWPVPRRRWRFASVRWKAAAAHVWVDNTSTIVAAVENIPGVLEEPVPGEVLDQFVALLETWQTLAATDEFYWTAQGG